MFLSVVVLQSPTHVWLFATPWIAACQISLSLTISRSLLKFMSITSVIPTNHLILCPLLLLLPSVFSNIRVFLNESVVHIRWPKDWSLSISPSNEYSGLISFKIVWFDLPAVQGTLKSLLQHQSSKAPVLWCSAFFMVYLSQSYVTTGKTIVLTIWTLISKVMPFFFNIVSGFLIAFLPTSNHLLVLWLLSPSAVIWVQEEEICHCFHLSSFYLPWNIRSL